MIFFVVLSVLLIAVLWMVNDYQAALRRAYGTRGVIRLIGLANVRQERIQTTQTGFFVEGRSVDVVVIMPQGIPAE